MVLVGAKGEPVEAEGSLKVLDRLEDALVLEWPLGAVPLSQYAGVADPDRLAHWVREIAKRLAALEAQGIRYAPRAELVLVKGRSVWLVGPGLEALAGEAASALLELARLLAGPRWEEFPLRDVLARLARGRWGWRPSGRLHRRRPPLPRRPRRRRPRPGGFPWRWRRRRPPRPLRPGRRGRSPRRAAPGSSALRSPRTRPFPWWSPGPRGRAAGGGPRPLPPFAPGGGRGLHGPLPAPGRGGAGLPHGVPHRPPHGEGPGLRPGGPRGGGA